MVSSGAASSTKGSTSCSTLHGTGLSPRALRELPCSSSPTLPSRRCACASATPLLKCVAASQGVLLSSGGQRLHCFALSDRLSNPGGGTQLPFHRDLFPVHRDRGRFESISSGRACDLVSFGLEPPGPVGPPIELGMNQGMEGREAWTKDTGTTISHPACHDVMNHGCIGSELRGWHAVGQ